MEFYINPAGIMPFFAVPCSLADSHLKLAGEYSLKILLYILRDPQKEISLEDIASYFRISASEARDALDYWVQAGIICKNSEEVPIKNEPAPKKAIRSAALKPTREEVIKRGKESEKIRFLLNEAQLKFGRPLKFSESSTLVWLFDDAGMDISLILMAIQFCVSSGKQSIREIEKTALSWVDSGVKTIEDAEKSIALLTQQETAWRLIESVFGLERRSPSAKEREFAYLSVHEWKFSREILRAAYEQCVDNTGKFSIPYIKKILEKWHKNGYKALEDIKDEEKKKKEEKISHAAYDLDAFIKKLNGED